MIFVRLRDRFFYPILKLISNIYNQINFKINGFTVGKGLSTAGLIHLSGRKGSLTIGNNVTINSASWANPIGCGSKTCINIIEPGRVIIGNNVGLSNVSISCYQSVVIKDNVLIGSGCCIIDTDFHPLKLSERQEKKPVVSRPVIIEENVFIGAGSFILKGSQIGVNSIIGAGAVVCGNIPPNQIWAGNPAKFIRDL